MNNIVASLSNNVLKVTFWGKDGFGSTSATVAGEVVNGSEILNADEFSEFLKGLISQVVPSKFKPTSINFLVEPTDCILEFATVSKNGGDVGEQILSVVTSKLPDGVVLEHLYFSYQKIAPFVYQFIGVKKNVLDKFLEVSTKLGLELESVMPWILLLPKLVGDNQPGIFVSKGEDKQVVALSELNGIYFVGVYDEEKSQSELEELVQTLSIYKRPAPISRIYTVNCDSFTLDPEYDVLPLEVPGGDLEDSKGYEIHLLFNNVLDKQKQVLETQVNLLNLLPVPVVVKNKVPMVAVGAAVVVLVLFLVGSAFYIYGTSGEAPPEGELTVNTEELPSVLSEVGELEEATESVEEVVELSRKDLKVSVENGSGVTGAAGRMRDFLEELDYEVLSIGDAEESNRETTLVKIKDSKTNYKDLLIKDLKSEYDLVFEEGLDENTAHDVLIVVGLK